MRPVKEIDFILLDLSESTIKYETLYNENNITYCIVNNITYYYYVL